MNLSASLVSEQTRKPLRGLIVDDSSFDRKILLLILSAHRDFSIVGTAGDGEECLRMARELEPDFITLDFDMPKLNGFETVEELRQFSDVPVILCSGMSFEQDAYAEALGIYESIMKTFSHSQIDFTLFEQELIEKIHRAVERKKTSPEKI